ncbi:MAG: DUF418 domain-containing protein, partial [Candidatus Poribacteria bacterium]
YVTHVVVGMVAPIAVRGEGAFSQFAVAAYACAFCGAATFLSHLCIRRFGRGPLEAVMRRLTG